MAPLSTTSAAARRLTTLYRLLQQHAAPSLPGPKKLPVLIYRNSGRTGLTPSWSAASWPAAFCACTAPLAAECHQLVVAAVAAAQSQEAVREDGGGKPSAHWSDRMAGLETG